VWARVSSPVAERVRRGWRFARRASGHGGTAGAGNGFAVGVAFPDKIGELVFEARQQGIGVFGDGSFSWIARNAIGRSEIVFVCAPVKPARPRFSRGKAKEKHSPLAWEQAQVTRRPDPPITHNKMGTPTFDRMLTGCIMESSIFYYKPCATPSLRIRP
jgi:hypothetical protein